jgi:hypothetical protein
MCVLVTEPPVGAAYVRSHLISDLQIVRAKLLLTGEDLFNLTGHFYESVFNFTH